VRGACLLLAAVLLSGCGSHSKGGIPASAAKRLVLQPRDLPAGYTSIGGGAQNPFTAGSADPKRFGREGGWYADYRRAPGATAGALIVQSAVDVFGDSGGAGKELDAQRSRFGAANGVSLPQLGDESFAARVAAAGATGAVVYTVVWRQRNVASSLVVTGLKGKLARPNVTALARRAAARVGAAEP